MEQINCTLPDFFCNPTADDLLYKIDGKVSTAQKCSHACKKNKNCNFFTFFNFRGSPSCFVLKGCNEKKPRCTLARNCVSGQKDCHNMRKTCPKLNLKKGDKARWRCKGINPYMKDIPEGTHCYAT